MNTWWKTLPALKPSMGNTLYADFPSEPDVAVRPCLSISDQGAYTSTDCRVKGFNPLGEPFIRL